MMIVIVTASINDTEDILKEQDLKRRVEIEINYAIDGMPDSLTRLIPGDYRLHHPKSILL